MYALESSHPESFLIAPDMNLAVLVACVDLIPLLVVEECSDILERHSVLYISRARLDARHAAAVENIGHIDASNLATVRLLAVRDNEVLLARDVDIVGVAVWVPKRMVLE